MTDEKNLRSAEAPDNVDRCAQDIWERIDEMTFLDVRDRIAALVNEAQRVPYDPVARRAAAEQLERDMGLSRPEAQGDVEAETIIECTQDEIADWVGSLENRGEAFHTLLASISIGIRNGAWLQRKRRERNKTSGREEQVSRAGASPSTACISDATAGRPVTPESLPLPNASANPDRAALVQKLSAVDVMVKTHAREVGQWKQRALEAEAELDKLESAPMPAETSEGQVQTPHKLSSDSSSASGCLVCGCTTSAFAGDRRICKDALACNERERRINGGDGWRHPECPFTRQTSSKGEP